MDRQDPPSWRRPHGPADPAPEEARVTSRDRGIRHVRRLSNWTAVALVAATAVTAGYLGIARHSAQGAATVTVSNFQAQGAKPGQPCVTVPVAVSGGSGVPARTVLTQSCGPGTSGGTSPAVAAANQGEGRGD
jgi:hypothetical protein